MEEIRQIETVQLLAWGMPDIEVIPCRFMHAVEHNGACLLAAYEGHKVIGFAFGLLGLSAVINPKIAKKAGLLQMYSAISGVLPEYQVQGIGYRLKMAQRDFALANGIRLITWTYDPLESRNGYFNVNKLGVICGRFLRNFHGDMGGINAGLPTDRFHVDWWLDSERVQGLVDGQQIVGRRAILLAENAEIVNQAAFDVEGLATPPADFSRSDSPYLLVEIPADFQRLKSRNLSLAIAWRQHTRQLFEHTFANGYQVTGFVRRVEAESVERSYYLLEKLEVGELPHEN
jgi:predicted GNAT superfamily acetyltransferase